MEDGEERWMLPIPEDHGPEELLNDSAYVNHHHTVRDLGGEGKMVGQEVCSGDMALRMIPTSLNAVFRGDFR